MQLEQSFELPNPPATAWPAFKDVELLVQCLPGAALTGPAAGGELPLRFDVKLGPIAAGFVGSGRVSFDDAAQGGRFEGSASDRRTNSRVKGAADFKLVAEGGGTRVTLRVDYSLTGALAQFSRGAILRELASALTAQFAANLALRLHAVAEPVESVEPTEPAEPAARDAPAAVAAPVVAAAPLDARPLLMLVLKASWQRLLGRLLRRKV
ncbi:MAG TPA: SRPBCC family protein [Burkholderiaceae bacterium]|jgi:carbon monoxide dehydrogenase subunit G